MNDWRREPPSWHGPVGFREERGRTRRRLGIMAGVGLVFGLLLLQVGVSTQVDIQGNKISRLEDSLQRTRNDLTVDSTRLTQGQIYGELLSAAERNGFGLARAYRDVKLVEPVAPAEPRSLAARLQAELRLSPRILLPEARAQEGRRGASRP